MLSLGVLSWKAHKTLRRTLETYAALKPLADECVIFFNEITDADRAIAAEFGFRAEGSPKNLGIMGGMSALLDSLRGETVLMLQNDCPVCVPPEETERRLREAQAAVESNRVRFVQLHDRLSDGPEVNRKFLRFYPGDDAPGTWAQRLRRLVRPCLARRMRGRAIWTLRNPELRFPKVFRREGTLLFTTSAYVNFSEQPFLAKRDYIRGLFDWCYAHKEGKHTFWNGQTSYEIILNTCQWRRQRLPIGISDGIFAHARWDDSFRATHAHYNPDLAPCSLEAEPPVVR